MGGLPEHLGSEAFERLAREQAEKDALSDHQYRQSASRPLRRKSSHDVTRTAERVGAWYVLNLFRDELRHAAETYRTIFRQREEALLETLRQERARTQKEGLRGSAR